MFIVTRNNEVIGYTNTKEEAINFCGKQNSEIVEEDRTKYYSYQEIFELDPVNFEGAYIYEVVFDGNDNVIMINVNSYPNKMLDPFIAVTQDDLIVVIFTSKSSDPDKVVQEAKEWLKNYKDSQN